MFLSCHVRVSEWIHTLELSRVQLRRTQLRSCLESSCTLDFSCSDCTFRFRACFEQGVPWHSGLFLCSAWKRSSHPKFFYRDAVLKTSRIAEYLFSYKDLACTCTTFLKWYSITTVFRMVFWMLLPKNDYVADKTTDVYELQGNSSLTTSNSKMTLLAG